MARRSMGRQKIEMKKMNKESNLLVTFSKRRAGLFKKAGELCILCGVEMAIVVFSPGKNKVYSFGHRNVEHVIDKFLNTNPTTDSGLFQPAEACIAELNMHLTDLHDQLETQMARGKWLADVRKQHQTLSWWEAPVEDLELEQLKTLKSGLTELKTSVAKRRNNLVLMQQVQKLTSSRAEGVEATDSSGSTLGIVMTPQGYAFF